MHILPDMTEHAAGNMARDQALLLAYGHPAMPRFRHYGWSHPAYTFGFAQKWGEELETLRQSGHEVIRRETGGGLVDHRQDWTYTLVIPALHPLGQEAPVEVYAGLHTCLAEALVALQVEVRLQAAPPAEPASGFRACFRQTEQFDVILPDGIKIAGAAQRRKKAGFLIQGYIDRRSLPGLDWEVFAQSYITHLSRWLRSEATPIAWPTLDCDLSALARRFASEAWNRHRKREERSTAQP